MKNSIFDRILRESSGEALSFEEYLKDLNTDEAYKQQFTDWVRDGIHYNDNLSYNRWEEIFDDFASSFDDDNSVEEVNDFKVEVDDGRIIDVWKSDGKWKTSDGKSFMGYLDPQDIITWLWKDYGFAKLVEENTDE